MKAEKAVLVLYSDPSRKTLIDRIESAIPLVLHRVDPTGSVHEQLRTIEEKASSARLSIGGVIGINDFASALAIAASYDLGFTAPPPQSAYRAQHKALFVGHAAARNPHYPPTRIIQSEADLPEEEQWYPAFLKPAAGSLSAHAFLAETPEDLRDKYQGAIGLERADVRWREALYGELMEMGDPPFSSFIVQPFLFLPQYTLDGYVHRGQIHLVGVTASIFDAAGHSFERFDFPAFLEEDAREELTQVVERLVGRLGYDDSCFNVEFFVTDEGHIVPIEFNTRLAFQFVPLFATHYANNYLVEACRLALGEKPRLHPLSAPRHASSCVLRVYEDREVITVPAQEEIDRIVDEGLAACVRVMVRPGTRLSDYKQDSYSFRYAIINVIHNDGAEMGKKLAEIKRRLKFVLKGGPL